MFRTAAATAYQAENSCALMPEGNLKFEVKSVAF
jgi:hypothetical protein